MTSLNNFLKKHSTQVAEGSKLEEQKEMETLLERLPVLNYYFQLHSKIGQGTFSTVYLATLKTNTSTQKYAVKHLTQACEQSRIKNELRCLQEIGGKDNVVPAELCLSNGENCVAFIMPYLAHCSFSEYVVDMDAEETSFYMKNLFIALKRVHSFNIIHRDIKPNNFLYNRETKQFLLVDFGLAQLVRASNQDKTKATTSVDENKPIDYSKKRKRSPDSSSDEKKSPEKENKRMALKLKDSNVRVSSALKASDDSKTEIKNIAIKGKDGLNSPTKQWICKPDVDKTPTKPKTLSSVSKPSCCKRKLLDFHAASTSENLSGVRNHSKPKRNAENCKKQSQSNTFTPLVSKKSSNGNFVQIRNSRVVRQQAISSSPGSSSFHKGMPSMSSFVQSCPCSGKGAVCSICSSRQPMFAPRAGTSGFRPPEVLFKYLHQTTAVDMWAAGVVMLCILSGCYPFFNSSTDLASLAEIMTIFGTERIINVAKKFGRRIVCSEYRKEIDLKKLCRRLRARSAKKPRNEKSSSGEPKCRDCFQTIRKDGCICRLDEAEISNEAGAEAASSVGEPFQFPDSAYDLLYRLLDVDPTTRITAAEALEHPFIIGPPQ